MAYNVTYDLLRERHAQNPLWVFDPAKDVSCRSIFKGNSCTIRGGVAGLSGEAELAEETARRVRDGSMDDRDGWWKGDEWSHHHTGRDEKQEGGGDDVNGGGAGGGDAQEEEEGGGGSSSGPSSTTNALRTATAAAAAEVEEEARSDWLPGASSPPLPW